MTTDVPHAPYGPLPEGGTVRPMTRWGTPVMHRPQAPVTAYDDELRALVADMVATMYAADGVGLAACQIGVDLAVFVFDCPDESGERTVGVVCNPVLDAARGQGPAARRRRRGLPVVPRRVRRVRPPGPAPGSTGTGLDGEPVSSRRRRAAGPVPAARDRPHPRHGVRRPAVDQGAQEAPEGAGEGGRRVPAGLAAALTLDWDTDPVPRIRIVHVDQPTHAAIAAGDLGAANRTSPVPLTPAFVTEGFRSTFARRAEQLLDRPEDQPWVTGIVWDEDLAWPSAPAGFHGEPRRRRDGRGRLLDRPGLSAPGLRAGRAAAAARPGGRASGRPRAPGHHLPRQRAVAQPDRTSSPSSATGEQWDEEDGLEWIFEIPTPTARCSRVTAGQAFCWLAATSTPAASYPSIRITLPAAAGTVSWVLPSVVAFVATGRPLT